MANNKKAPASWRAPRRELIPRLQGEEQEYDEYHNQECAAANVDALALVTLIRSPEQFLKHFQHSFLLARSSLVVAWREIKGSAPHVASSSQRFCRGGTMSGKGAQ